MDEGTETCASGPEVAPQVDDQWEQRLNTLPTFESTWCSEAASTALSYGSSASAIVTPCEAHFFTFIVELENLLCCALAVLGCILTLGVVVSPERIVIDRSSRVGKRGLRLQYSNVHYVGSTVLAASNGHPFERYSPR